MRIAFVDLLFSWPPHGGADVDVYYVLRELKNLGYEVQLFAVREEGSWERGDIQEEPPFPLTLLEFSEGELTEQALAETLPVAVEQFAPHLIFLTQGYFFKTVLTEILCGHPLLTRCYAHEIHCQKDILRFRDGAPCPHSYAKAPDICRPCALHYQRQGVSTGRNWVGGAWEPYIWYRTNKRVNWWH
jgi:hypothetical protein